MVIGKTARPESLRTNDHLIACRKRADLVARYNAEIARQAEVDTVALLDQAFQRLAKARGSMDRAIQLQLQLLANSVVDSWAGAGQDLGEQWWGDFLVHEPVICDEPVPSLESEHERTIYRLRAALLEGRGIVDGLVHQELAAILLDREVYHPLIIATCCAAGSIRRRPTPSLWPAVAPRWGNKRAPRHRQPARARHQRAPGKAPGRPADPRRAGGCTLGHRGSGGRADRPALPRLACQPGAACARLVAWSVALGVQRIGRRRLLSALAA